MSKWTKLLAGLVLILTTGVARADFEGVVDYQYSFGEGKTMDAEYMIKGKKFRMNMSHDGNEMSSIMDMGSKEVITLMHKQKMYMVSHIDKAMTSASKYKPEGKFYKASGSKDILGYSCEHWVYEGKHGKSDIWGAKGLGTFMGMGGGKPGSSGVDEWVKAIKSKGFFPLEMDTTSEKGKTVSMKATKVEKKSLSSDLFKAPSDYKKMPDMSEAMKKYKGPSGDDMIKGMKPKMPF